MAPEEKTRLTFLMKINIWMLGSGGIQGLFVVCQALWWTLGVRMQRRISVFHVQAV